jgi:hypothetical protein
MSYSTITLFSDHTDSSQRSTPFAASILIHSLALALLLFGLMYTPRVVNSAQSERYTVRQLVLQRTSHTVGQFSKRDTSPDSRRSADAALAATEDAMAAYLQETRKIDNAEAGPHTLIQPEVHSRLTLPHETAIPSFIIWMPSNTQVTHIVAPFVTKTGAAAVTPSVSMPDNELRPVNLAIRSTDQTTLEKRLRLLPGTSSPVRVEGPDLTQTAPLTVMQVSDKPTPVAVLSLSDLRMTDGTAILPPGNQSAGTKEQDGLTPSHAYNPSTGIEHAQGKAGDAHTSDGAIEKPVVHDPGPARGNGDVLNSGGQPSASLITLAKNGHFESVVVGASLEDQFPEMEGFWNGRMLYTAYLHVGLAQSWILQYSLPRSDTAAAAGNVARLESPWPYSIVRPDLAPGSINADALMIKGFISQDGHFEMPALIFPPSFPLAQFVLDCLRQWQFRPAFQNGQPARVEILLIIPDSE